MQEIKIAVKELAFKLYSSGDLTNEFFYNHDENEALQAHQYLQSRYNKDSFSEYHVTKEEDYLGYHFIINGFIDGVLINKKQVIIEEIKSTKLPLEKITRDYHLEYLAQLKLYMALYASLNNLKELKGRLTYISLKDYETKHFDYHFTSSELNDFLHESLEKYLEWNDLFLRIKREALSSLKNLRFPFANYRPHQQEFMKAIFATLKKKEILYGIAPTGLGKTVSVIYPSLKTVKNNQEKIFYLTAKDTLKLQAIKTVSLMQESGLAIRLLELSSKEKMCLLKSPVCNPETCPYAKGYFERVNLALKEVLSNEHLLTSNIIHEYALKYNICPFEFSLSLSNYSEFIVGDYNYVFDPRVKLIRYFASENDYEIKVLVDEAHNLVKRSLEMYSSEFSFNDLKVLRRVFKDDKPSIKDNISKLKKYVKSHENELTDNHLVLNDPDLNIIDYLVKISDKLKKILETLEPDEIKKRQEGIKVYFELTAFLKINSLYSSSHRFIIEKESEDNYLFKISCFDASKFLIKDLQEHLAGTIFFSATLTPLDYYQRMLTNKVGEHIIIPPIFPKENFKLIFMDKISTYYKDRSASLETIVETIKIMEKAKKGNYIIFFPSYEYLLQVYQLLKTEKLDFELVLQEKKSSKEEREKVLNLFNDTINPKVGLFVMGGIYSEGIDFVGEKLRGVLIVGVGIPQINYENEISKRYFESVNLDGYHYAYTYPGFNKVLQAAGRVIRSMTDKGVVIIMDKRITTPLYLEMLPSNFKHFKRINQSIYLEKELKNFFK